MPRLIDADAFCDEMRHRQNECAKWRDETDDESIKTRADGALSAFIECKLTLNKMPTVEERKTGEWIKEHWHGEHTRRCSACNITQTVTTYRGKVNFNYCPYCGADMRTAKCGTEIDQCVMDEVGGGA